MKISNVYRTKNKKLFSLHYANDECRTVGLSETFDNYKNFNDSLT